MSEWQILDTDGSPRLLYGPHLVAMAWCVSGRWLVGEQAGGAPRAVADRSAALEALAAIRDRLDGADETWTVDALVSVARGLADSPDPGRELAAYLAVAGAEATRALLAEAVLRLADVPC